MMYSPLRYIPYVFWKKRPIHLTFFVTRKCNARCPFCFYLKNNDTAAPAAPELSLEEISKVSRSVGSLLWIAFSGGEIYLRDDLTEISTIFYENNTPSVMLYPTNGMLPGVIRERTEEIVRRCKKSIIVVKLSMDGIGRSHDTIRNTPGSFELTMETYHQLRGLIERYPNFELGINTVFCPENQDSMDALIDFVRDLKNIKTHTISLIRGNIADRYYKDISYEKYYRAIARLEKDLKKRTSPIYRFKGAGIKAAQDILQRRFIHETVKEQRRLIPCYAGRLNLVLTEKGDVYPCEVLTGKFGNIRDMDYDIMRAVRTEKARNILGSIEEGKCFCTHECYFMTNILFNPRMYPGLLSEYLHLGRGPLRGES